MWWIWNMDERKGDYRSCIAYKKFKRKWLSCYLYINMSSLFISLPEACFLLQCHTYLTSRKLSYFKLFSETPNQSAFVIAYYMYRYHILDKIHIRPVLISKHQISFYFYFSTFKFLVTLHHFITLKQSRKHKYYM